MLILYRNKKGEWLPMEALGVFTTRHPKEADAQALALVKFRKTTEAKVMVGDVTLYHWLRPFPFGNILRGGPVDNSISQPRRDHGQLFRHGDA